VSGPQPKRRPAAAPVRRRSERPYVLALFATLVVVAGMLVGPLQSLTAAESRVSSLEASKAHLTASVDELEDRRRRLSDPVEIELMARERLGMVMPGEIPYVVARDEPEIEKVRPDGFDLPPADSRSWLSRAVEAFGDLFD
jgi:cell division protein FtsB